MNLLKKELEKLIPETQQEIKDLINKKGDTQISTVSVSQAYSGLRGIKAFVCDTSSVSADKGLIIRGYWARESAPSHSSRLRGQTAYAT